MASQSAARGMSPASLSSTASGVGQTARHPPLVGFAAIPGLARMPPQQQPNQEAGNTTMARKSLSDALGQGR